MRCPGPDTRQESLAELGELASRMAHEIRNPLNAIRMQVAVIRNKLLKPDPHSLEIARGQLERLESEVLRVDRLAKAFLEFGRPPADEPEDIRLAEVVEEIASLTSSEFEELGHTLRVRINESGDAWVRMDRGKLRQVLFNLLANARNAMVRPGVAAIELSRAAEDYASIRVEDTGKGIPPEELADIFLPFHSFTANGEGLGLAIAKRIVDTAGGCIRVQSQVGQGTCFEVLLPLVDVGVG